MVALRIEDQRAFTSALFVGDKFDFFQVREAQIVTFNSFAIDGRIRQGYYSDEEREEGKIGEYSTWRVIRPVCFSLIKGKRLPESFRIVFALPPEVRERFVRVHAPSLPDGAVGGLYLNIQYEKQEMSGITGTALQIFTLDKTLEREWDGAVKLFFKKNGIAVTE